MDTRFRGGTIRGFATEVPAQSKFGACSVRLYCVVVVLERVLGSLETRLGQILPATNNRVTSRKPLTAADELVPGEGGRGSRSVAAGAAAERGDALEDSPAPGCRASGWCRRVAGDSQCAALRGVRSRSLQAAGLCTSAACASVQVFSRLIS